MESSSHGRRRTARRWAVPFFEVRLLAPRRPPTMKLIFAHDVRSLPARSLHGPRVWRRPAALNGSLPLARALAAALAGALALVCFAPFRVASAQEIKGAIGGRVVNERDEIIPGATA